MQYVYLLLAAALSAGPLYQYVGTKLDIQKYPPLGKMIDVGGYKLHMIDQGSGYPTVVIDAGLGSSSLDSQLVQPEIAKFTRVVAYDRAGYAWSDASPLTRTSENIVQELHTLLKNSNIPAPYILVGYSFGGLNVRLFADKYPDEVAGVVLVDASHENTKSTDAGSFSKSLEKNYHKYKAYLERVFGLDRWKQDPHLNKRVEKYPQDIQQMYLALRLSTKRLNTGHAELDNFDTSCSQIKASGGIVGNKPLVVITAGKKMTADDSGHTQKQLDKKELAKAEMQKDLVTKSSCGKQVFAEKGGHNINYDQPEIIVDVVREMVDQLRIKTGCA